MKEIALCGYNTSSYEASLGPGIESFDGESKKSLLVHCFTVLDPNGVNSMLGVDIEICGFLPDQEPDAEHEPFLRMNCQCIFQFEAAEPVSDEEMETYLRNDGVMIAIPLMRGMLVGAANILNLPDIFSFPPVDPKMISWSDPA